MFQRESSWELELCVASRVGKEGQHFLQRNETSRQSLQREQQSADQQRRPGMLTDEQRRPGMLTADSHN